MQNDDLRLQDEYTILTRLVEGEGWLLMHSKWQKLIDDCNKALKDKDNNETRDWYAGLLTGYERLFNWPNQRLMIIEKKLKESSDKQITASKPLNNLAGRN